MNNVSPQSKSFVVLAVIAILGAFFVVISSTSPWNNSGYQQAYKSLGNTSGKDSKTYLTTDEVNPTLPDVSTTGWKSYSNAQYGIQFLYDPTWKVLAPVTKSGYAVIQVDPGRKFYNFTIYISKNEFAGTQGFQGQQETIGGFNGTNIQNAVYAVKGAQYYYTFDEGQSMSLKPQFRALVKSVTFLP